MEIYYGGTEIQLGVIRLPVAGRCQPLSREEAEIEQGQVVKELIKTNNQTRLYGIPANADSETASCAWLFNGGLVYFDMGHPEYATPEVHSLQDLFCYELAGRRIVNNLLKLNSLNHPTHGVFANNTDYHGQTFAYHENYRCLKPPDNMVPFLWPFLITRQIFAGAGQVLSTYDKQANPVSDWFSISQRSLHANIRNGRESLKVYIGNYSVFAASNRHNSYLFHFTGGDATTTRTTTQLKIGSTAMVLKMVEEGWIPPETILLRHQSPVVNNLKAIALDPEFKWRYHADGYTCSAIDVQKIYLEQSTRRFATDPDPEIQWTLKTWAQTLNILEANPLDAWWLDWVSKYKLLSHLKARSWTQEELVRTDLAFHAADPDRSIFKLVGGYGTDETKIAYAMYHPPPDTRAFGRGLGVRAIDACAERQPGLLKRINAYATWQELSLMGTSQIRLKLDKVKQTYIEEAQRFQKTLEEIYPTV